MNMIRMTAIEIIISTIILLQIQNMFISRYSTYRVYMICDISCDMLLFIVIMVICISMIVNIVCFSFIYVV